MYVAEEPCLRYTLNILGLYDAPLPKIFKKYIVKWSHDAILPCACVGHRNDFCQLSNNFFNISSSSRRKGFSLKSCALWRLCPGLMLIPCNSFSGLRNENGIHWIFAVLLYWRKITWIGYELMISSWRP